MHPALAALNFIRCELEGGRDWPSPEAIGNACNCSAQTARNHLAWLTVNGYVRRLNAGGRGKRALYELTEKGAHE
jgi:hypothetical protein